ncbi:hypothetical protein QE109_02135 [Fusibacter bizertensis]|uniref:DUF4830 domain-containing protein n=1 Tax=Fusibacter bizertensis TaxID=1488331 RepID=A0ABT6N936_9FIRM|nr:hypothetical protein [Fusibacter bizertensis]MDH8676925.1 hypothetical protein [Fusibacter bizertensis]
MKKNTVFGTTIIVLFIIVALFFLYPRELVKIIGNEPPISSNTSLSIIQKNNILEPGNVVESLNKNTCKEIYNYLSTFKYMRSNISYKKLDEKETYVIIMKNNEKEIFRAAIRGNSYISIMDKNENWTIYKVIGEKINLNFFENIYNSLSEN